MTVGNMLCEAVGMVSALVYAGLQIYCGVLYSADVMTIFTNVLMLLLVYVGLTMLEIYPEKVNRLDPEVCTGKVRRYTIHMVLYAKLIFVISLLFAAICDVIGREVDGAYSLISVGLMVLVAVGYEIKIFKILRNND
ncbi:MAG: transglycosylase [Roseburia sp.]|nr:transglycosylase [Roseburia sp.]